MSRLFDGINDSMTYTGMSALTGATTLLIVVKIVTTNDTAWLSFLDNDNGAGATRPSIGRRDTGNIYYSDGIAIDDAVAIQDADGWAVIAATRPAGAAQTVRAHKCVIGGAPTHTNVGLTFNNVSATVRLRIGGPGDWANIKVAAAAIFNADLTDGNLEGIATAATTQSIADLSPYWLVDDSDAFATNLVNPGTGDRSAITDTADDADDPAGWVYGIAGPTAPTISVVGAGAVTFGAAAGTTVAPPIPTHVAGNLLVAVRAMKHSTTESLTAEAGWTRGVDEQAGGTGSFAADTGPTKICIDYLEATGAGTTVTFDNTAAANTVAWAQVIVLRKNVSGAIWNVAGISGTDNSAGAAYSVAFASNPGLTTKDFAVIGVSTPTDITASHWSTTVSLTATGLTATVTEQGDAVSGNGFDIGAGTWTAEVTAGPATANATFAATASGTTTNIAGPCALLRVRADVTPTLVASLPRR